MSDTGLLTDPLFIVCVIVIAAVIVYFAFSGLYLIQDDQVGIKRKKMFGKTMPQGHIIALDGEIGIQADTFMPGLYWKMPFICPETQKRLVSEWGKMVTAGLLSGFCSLGSDDCANVVEHRSARSMSVISRRNFTSTQRFKRAPCKKAREQRLRMKFIATAL